MFYTLAKNETNYVSKLNKFIAFSPCIYNDDYKYDDYENTVEKLRHAGIVSYYGPNWTNDFALL